MLGFLRFDFSRPTSCRSERRARLALERAARMKAHQRVSDTDAELKAVTHAELLASVDRKTRTRLAPYLPGVRG